MTAFAVWIGILAGTAAAENNTYQAGALEWNRYEKMAVSLQWDFQQSNDTDFFDFWGLDSKASNRWAPSSVGWEVKLPKYFALEVAAGYSRFESDSADHPLEDDTAALKMDAFHSRCSVKRYGYLTDLLSLYGGVGADFVYVDAILDYEGRAGAYRQENTHMIYGGHALVGVECRTGKRTSPFSFDLSLRYTVLETAALDRELVEVVNDDEDEAFSSGDLDLGGITLSVGLKYHF